MATYTVEHEVVTGANSGALNTAIKAVFSTTTYSGCKVIGFACKSDDSAFYALITYRKTA